MTVRAEPLTGSLRLHGLVERFWEGVGLSLLWVVGCLPVVTAGTSTLALYHVVAQRRRGDIRPVTAAFWAEFRRAPLARAAVTVVTLLALAGAFLTLVLGITVADPVVATAFQAAGLIGLAVVLGAVVTALPMQAERPGGLLGTLRLAAAVGLGRPLATTAAVLLTVAVGVGAVLFPPLLLVLGWGWAALVTALVESSVRRLGGATR
ncbi:MAG: DUF624 domain-containing protein [Propionibacteriaceae bacterium]